MNRRSKLQDLSDVSIDGLLNLCGMLTLLSWDAIDPKIPVVAVR